jgi:hypothetical protein
MPNDSPSTGIDAVSISVYSEDSDGPITVSPGINAASFSDSSIVLESLPSLQSPPWNPRKSTSIHGKGY